MKRANRIMKLNELLKHHQGYTVIELMAKLDVEDSTIRKDLSLIQRPPYNAVLANKYKGKERVYRYKDLDFSLSLAEEDDEIKQNLQKAIKSLDKFEGTPQFDWLKLCFMAIENGSVSGLSGVMSFENNAELTGIEHITSILNAIVKKYPIKLTYKPYKSDKQQFHVHPYHLRQYNKRWFLIGTPDGTYKIHNYAIDRIIDVKHLSKPYIETTIDFDEFFDDVIGITVCDVPTQQILMMVNKNRYPYIKTKPLHWSQKELKERNTDDKVCISINVKPNYELYSTLLSFGSDVIVISPESIRREMQEKVAELYNSYK